MGMTSNIKYTCRGLPLLDSGCHHSSCFTCISTTLQSRSEVQTTWFFNRNVEVLVTVMQVKNLKVIPILEWPNVRFSERILTISFSMQNSIYSMQCNGRIMPNCWLSSRVSIAVASLCFTIPRILRGHKYAVPQLENSSKRSIIIIRGQFINWSSKAGTKSLKGVCLLVITTSGSGQSLRWKPPKTWTSCHDQISSLCTVFENHPKCRIWIFQFWHFPPIFDLLKLTCLVTLFDRKLQVFKNRQNEQFLAFLINFCPLKT